MNTTTEVKERPILFSTPMEQAILEGRKTVTRRIIKESFNGCLTNGGPHPCPNDPVVIYPGETYESPCHPGESITVDCPEVRAIFHCSTLDAEAKCPYGKPGDILWVRETWARNSTGFDYKADFKAERYQWKPSIHMPKAACRLKLEIVSIGVERLQDITEEDAIREGIRRVTKDNSVFKYCVYDRGDYSSVKWTDMPKIAKKAFQNLWTSINGPESWQANPWVWRIEFKKL